MEKSARSALAAAEWREGVRDSPRRKTTSVALKRGAPYARGKAAGGRSALLPPTTTWRSAPMPTLPMPNPRTATQRPSKPPAARGSRTRHGPVRGARAGGTTLAALAVLAPLLLSGCASEAGPPVLTWYINPDAGGQAAIAQKCTEAAERRATASRPRSCPTMPPASANSWPAGSRPNDSSLDIMSLDPPFIPELAEPGFLAPVPEATAATTTANTLAGAPRRGHVEGTSWSPSRSGPTPSCSGTANRWPRPPAWT